MILVSPPSGAPVSIEELAHHLRIDAADDDLSLAAYLASAVTLIEGWTGRAMLQRTYRLFLDCWPSGRDLRLPMPPLVSVTHVKTYDDDDVAATMPASDYFVDLQDARIALRNAAAWPRPERRRNGIEVEWVAGYATAPDVPENLRLAVMLTVGHWYRNREAVITAGAASELPLGVEALIAQSRVWAI